MRRGKGFTPRVLRKWNAEGQRGEGVFADYQPWHQVTRSDPASLGRSHLTFCPKLKRMRHQLSDGEQKILGFSLMVPSHIDIREQFKLEREDHCNHLTNYDPQSKTVINKGTLKIADSLGIKHPEIIEREDKEYWILSTDFLITCKSSMADDAYELIAVSCKTLADLNKRRKRNLLKIEREYWLSEKATWLLLTPRQYNKSVGETVLRVLPWVMHPYQVSIDLKKKCSEASKFLNGQNYTKALSVLEKICEIETDLVPLVFWQTVWSGLLNVDLSISRFSSDNVRLLEGDAFWNQNPIVMRRSECL